MQKADNKNPGRARQRFFWFGIWFGFATTISLLRFGYQYLSDLAEKETGTFLPRLIEETTGAYTSSLLFVCVIIFTLRFRLQRVNWLRRLPAYLLGMVLFSAIHTTLMRLTRILI